MNNSVNESSHMRSSSTCKKRFVENAGLFELAAARAVPTHPLFIYTGMKNSVFVGPRQRASSGRKRNSRAANSFDEL